MSTAAVVLGVIGVVIMLLIVAVGAYVFVDTVRHSPLPARHEPDPEEGD